MRAVENIKQIFAVHGEEYELDIIDIYKQPLLAETQQLVALPVLLREMPLPKRKITGDLSNTEKVLKVLGIAADGR